MIARPVEEPTQSVAAVCRRILPTLRTNAEFRALPAKHQDALARELVAAAADAARAIGTQHADKISAATRRSVEFPSFVADLINGTFDAIVDASVEQMKAYAELLRNVAKSADDFAQDNDTDGCEAGDDECLRRAARRQQLLASMVLMGINRIVVTDGHISASASFDLRPRPRITGREDGARR